MGNVGPMEIVIVLIIALIVLGPQRLPEAARSVGRGVREFRGALSSNMMGDDDDRDDVEEVDEGEDEDQDDRALPRETT